MPSFRTAILIGLISVGSCAKVAATPTVTTTTPSTASPHLATGRWVRILATNDFHGALEPRRDSRGVLRGGAATLAAEINRARAECHAQGCVAILLDGGDEFQGTPVSNFGYGRPVVTLFNRLGRTASALGNHEFDWGQDTLRARMREAAYPILGANVTDAAGKDIAWIPDDTVVTIGGLKVGIVGVATVVTPTTTKPTNVSDLRFVDPIPVVNRSAKAMRARGAQLVVVVAHAGAFCQTTPTPSCEGEIVDLARGVTERIDAIVSGHTHSPVTTVMNDIPIVQARSHGTALGVMDISLSGASPKIELRDILPGQVAPDAGIDSLVRAVTAPLQEIVNRPLAAVADAMSGAVLGNYMADAFRAAGGGDVAVMNIGGVRAGIDTGTVTYGELFEVAPFGNMLVRLTISGAGLRVWLEKVVLSRAPLVSGAVVTVDSTRPRGSRVVSVSMGNGQPIVDTQSYRLVYSDFLHANGDGMQATEGVQKVEELGIVDIDALTEAVRRNAPVRAPRDQRVIFRTP